MPRPLPPDGLHFVTPRPVYLCQFADRDRVGEFLDNPSALATDKAWNTFGFSSRDEYVFWAPRLCGLVCLKMVIDSTALNIESVAMLTDEGVRKGGYLVRDAAGNMVDKGWIYKPLAKMARERGLDSRVLRDQTIDDLAGLIVENQAVIASVNPRVIRGDEPPSEAAPRGGHLVVVYGVDIQESKPSRFFLYNPSGRTPETQEAVVPAELVASTFAGRGFAIRLSRDA